MNVSAAELVNRIRLNLERARWLPQDFAERYVLVNIAHYRVGLYEQERLERTIKAVVGKYHQQTPVFAAKMTYAVVNPYWNVPRSILQDEIAPQAAKDPSYISRKHMEVVRGWDDPEILDPVTIDWNDVYGWRRRLPCTAKARRLECARTNQVHVPERLCGVSSRYAGAGLV